MNSKPQTSSEIACVRRMIKAICVRALESGRLLPQRQVIADTIGVPVGLVWRAFDALRQSGEVITQGPKVMMVKK